MPEALSVRIGQEKDIDTLSGTFSIEIDNEDNFKKVLKNLRAVPAILNIQQVWSEDSKV